MSRFAVCLLRRCQRIVLKTVSRFEGRAEAPTKAQGDPVPRATVLLIRHSYGASYQGDPVRCGRGTFQLFLKRIDTHFCGSTHVQEHAAGLSWKSGTPWRPGLHQPHAEKALQTILMGTDPCGLGGDADTRRPLFSSVLHPASYKRPSSQARRGHFDGIWRRVSGVRSPEGQQPLSPAPIPRILPWNKPVDKCYLHGRVPDRK